MTRSRLLCCCLVAVVSILAPHFTADCFGESQPVRFDPPTDTKILADLETTTVVTRLDDSLKVSISLKAAIEWTAHRVDDHLFEVTVSLKRIEGSFVKTEKSKEATRTTNLSFTWSSGDDTAFLRETPELESVLWLMRTPRRCRIGKDGIVVRSPELNRFTEVPWGIERLDTEILPLIGLLLPPHPELTPEKMKEGTVLVEIAENDPKVLVSSAVLKVAGVTENTVTFELSGQSKGGTNMLEAPVSLPPYPDMTMKIENTWDTDKNLPSSGSRTLTLGLRDPAGKEKIGTMEHVLRVKNKY